jgi:hypothetical protein
MTSYENIKDNCDSRPKFKSICLKTGLIYECAVGEGADGLGGRPNRGEEGGSMGLLAGP